jgi:hypothetical protein
MVIVEVKTKWHGMVAIRDKYYARAKVEGLTIKFFNQQITLTPAQVVDEIMMGAAPIPDKFSDKTHKLLYYRWAPNKQEVPPAPRLM